jgi:ribosome maturation factor RimP
MTKGELLALVRQTAEAAAEQAGCELVDVEFLKEGAHWYLRVFIDKDGGVSLEDCEAVNGPVNRMLDETDPIEQPFFLEVSSPGLERPLKTPRDYEKALNSLVELSLYRPIEGVRHLEGSLMEYHPDRVVIAGASGETRTIAKADIAKINRKFIF